MFEIASNLMIEFSSLIPAMVVFILVFNLIADLLWGGR